ncbi:MAG: hypothetical protein ABI072_09875 [Edaphobacter sp.]
MRAKRTVAMAMVFGVVLVSGCRVSSDKHGDSDNVKIATPFGGVQVKTNDAVVLSEIGLPAYPGAVLMKKDNGKKDGAADVNFSFGSFHLKVRAAKYQSGDSPEKVSAFYRKALGRYGDVVACQDNKAIGTPTQTAEGLTCDNDKENHITVSSDQVAVGKGSGSKMELKAGSKQHQHIVSIEPDGAGTKIGMVALDLPGHFPSGDGDREDRQ